MHTFCFCSFQFNSFAIICITRGRASSAASTFKNERRVRLARISTAVRAYSLIAYITSASIYGNSSCKRLPTTGHRFPVKHDKSATLFASSPYVCER
jgi:hypothetical protein